MERNFPLGIPAAPATSTNSFSSRAKGTKLVLYSVCVHGDVPSDAVYPASNTSCKLQITVKRPSSIALHQSAHWQAAALSRTCPECQSTSYAPLGLPSTAVLYLGCAIPREPATIHNLQQHGSATCRAFLKSPVGSLFAVALRDRQLASSTPLHGTSAV